MSKKDCQAIAAAIYARRQMARNIQNTAARLTHYSELAESLADVFAADNPRFSRERFLEACETGHCKGMRRVA